MSAEPTLAERRADPGGGPLEPWKLRDIASLIDKFYPDDPAPVVQDDLRRWADELERGERP